MSEQKDTSSASGVASELNALLEGIAPIAFMWEESWKDADTQYGPGDYNTELVFDTNPPTDGVSYSKLYTEDQVVDLLRSNAGGKPTQPEA